MRIFLIWTSVNPEVRRLISGLQSQSHEVAYWVGSRQNKVENEFPNIMFHDHFDALDGKPAKGLRLSDFDPPSEEIIDHLHKVESLILTNMNKRFDWMCTDERRHLYYNMLQYWDGVIKKYAPEIIIFTTTPHAIYDYLLYELAHLYGIKTFLFYQTLISDRILYYFDFWKGSDRLLGEIKRNERKNFSLQDLSPDIREYYKLQTDPNRDSTPKDIIIYRRSVKLSNRIFAKAIIILKSVLDLSIFKKSFLYLFKLFGENIKKEYYALQNESDFNKKFVYAPLNYQPENTTSPQAGIFVDQILMIEILSHSVPDGWTVYVKEHPTQWSVRGLNFFSSRYRGYYKRISKLKNVKIVPIETDSYILINKSQAVAAATGTAAFEAVFRSKPAIIFGYPWFRNCHGIFKVDSVESCKAAMQKILNGFCADHQKIINYLKSFDSATIHGFIDDIGYASDLSAGESMDNIIKTLLIEIKK